MAKPISKEMKDATTGKEEIKVVTYEVKVNDLERDNRDELIQSGNNSAIKDSPKSTDLGINVVSIRVEDNNPNINKDNEQSEK